MTQHEVYAATLSSRASEVERLVLLVEKLQSMLFGTKSEKVLRQIEQLELHLEELQAASAIEETQRSLLPIAQLPRSRSVVHFPRIFHAKSIPTCRTMRPAMITVADYEFWAKTLPRCWSGCGHASASKIFSENARSNP